jgi:hypothetical protein
VDSEFERRSLEAYTQKLRVFGVSSSEIAKCETKQKAKSMLKRVCERDGFEVPFLQIFNIHRGSKEEAGVIRSVATSQGLGRMAADLLGVDAVMLYQVRVREEGRRKRVLMGHFFHGVLCIQPVMQFAGLSRFSPSIL